MHILRGILAVVVGYILMFVLQAIGLAIGYFVVPMEKIYQGDTLHVTPLWTVIMLVTGLVGAVIGGIAAAIIGGSPKRTPVKVLAVLVLVLGMVGGYLQVQGVASRTESQLTRAEDMDVWKAASVSAPPSWYSYSIPVVGAAGVLLGGLVFRKRSREDLELME